MDFLIYSRAAPDRPDEDDRSLDERHWSYMDHFADAMTARGPTLEPDRETWTGSMHIVELPDASAADEFVAQEPYNRAGKFASHSVWRFDNLLGRTMWQSTLPSGEPRFLVLAHGLPNEPAHAEPARALPAELDEGLIVHGRLRDADSNQPAGIALAVQAPSREALDVRLAGAADALAGYDVVEVHDWEFGGRR